MLFLPPDQAKPSRIQGAFVNDAEIKNLVSFIKNQGIPVQYTDEVTTMTKSGKPAVAGVSGDTDDLFSEAIKVVCQYDRASASLLQRRLSIGYARAARVIDQLQDAGVIAPSDGSSKPREVLIKNADLIISAIGKAKFIKREMIKEGAVIIDAGTSEDNGAVVGDVDVESVIDVASYVSPNPGGVGPVTVAMLLSNVLQVAKNKK